MGATQSAQQTGSRWEYRPSGSTGARARTEESMPVQLGTRNSRSGAVAPQRAERATRYMCHACTAHFQLAQPSETATCTACGSEFVEEDSEPQPLDVDTLRAMTEQLQISPAELLMNLGGTSSRAELAASLQAAEQSRMQRAFYNSLYTSNGSSDTASSTTAASEAAVASLSRDQHASGECSICLENMHDARRSPSAAENETSSDPALITPCFHRFHAQCLLSWLRTNHICPVCQRSLEESAAQTRKMGTASASPKHSRTPSDSMRHQQA